MKGRGNYLCRQKLYALRDQPILTGIDLVDQFNTIRDWEQTTEHGDRAELIDNSGKQSALGATRCARRSLPWIVLSEL